MGVLFVEKLSMLSLEVKLLTSNFPGDFAIAVHDLTSSHAWQYNSRPMRSASLIKLFIMAEAFDQFRTGNLDPESHLTFAESDRIGGAGLLQKLPVGSSFSVLELVELMITESDNIATNLLIDRLGTEKINYRIQSLACHDSTLRRKMMDFAAAVAGQENLTSVNDMVTILTALHHGCCVDPVSDRQMCHILERQTDRCKIPLLLPTPVICRHKTGELPGAEHDAGVILSPNCAYVVAIMSDNLADSAEGCRIISRISRVVYDCLNANQ